MLLINEKYAISTLLGEGQFGKVYKGENIRTKEQVAIKIEPVKIDIKLIKNESNIYQYLKDTIVKTAFTKTKDEVNYYMVLDLLGQSLDKLIQMHGSLSLKITRYIGIKLLYLIMTLHNNNIIHRDLKPDNFLFDLKKTNNYNLHLIDFGLSRTYTVDREHITFKKVNNVIGNLSYCSVNSHNYMELSRRDDLESIGYIIVYFLKIIR